MCTAWQVGDFLFGEEGKNRKKIFSWEDSAVGSGFVQGMEHICCHDGLVTGAVLNQPVAWPARECLPACDVDLECRVLAPRQNFTHTLGKQAIGIRGVPFVCRDISGIETRTRNRPVFSFGASHQSITGLVSHGSLQRLDDAVACGKAHGQYNRTAAKQRRSRVVAQIDVDGKGHIHASWDVQKRERARRCILGHLDVLVTQGDVPAEGLANDEVIERGDLLAQSVTGVFRMRVDLLFECLERFAHLF